MPDSFCDSNTENMQKFSTLRGEVILQTISEKYNEKIGRTEVKTLPSSLWLIVTRNSSYYFSCFTKVKMWGTLLLIVYCLNKYRRVPTGFKDEIASHSTFNVKWVSEPVFAMLARLFSNNNRNGNHNFFNVCFSWFSQVRIWKLPQFNSIQTTIFLEKHEWFSHHQWRFFNFSFNKWTLGLPIILLTIQYDTQTNNFCGS